MDPRSGGSKGGGSKGGGSKGGPTQKKWGPAAGVSHDNQRTPNAHI